MLVGTEKLKVAEGAHDNLVRAQGVGRTCAQKGGHGSWQYAISIGGSRGDLGGDLILQSENVGGLQVAIIALRPQMGAAAGLDQLHGDSHCRSRLADAALHHVAGAKFRSEEHTSELQSQSNL